MSWPVSTEFLAALRQPHTPTMRLEILEGGVVVASTDVLAIGDHLTVVGGSVISDRRAAVRRNATVELVDTAGLVTPLLSSATVHPLVDREVRVWRGIDGVPANDTDDMVPLATVQLLTLDIDETEAGVSMVIGGQDRSADLQRRDWRDAFSVDGETLADASHALLAHVAPDYTFTTAFAPSDLTVPRQTFLPGEEPSPWQALVKWWEAAGMEPLFDQMGRLVTRAIPDPATTPPAFSYVDGPDNIRVAPLRLSVDRSTLVNGVIVRGSASYLLYGVSGEAWDTDPTSPTYFDPAFPDDSPVGPHPEYVDNPVVASDAEAAAVAAALLPDRLGIEERVTLSGVPNPALEAGDVILVESSVVAGRYVFDQVSTPISPDQPQEGNTRRRTR